MYNEELNDISRGMRYQIDGVIYKDFPRPYLGLSMVGHPCARYLWYYFRVSYLSELERMQVWLSTRGKM